MFFTLQASWTTNVQDDAGEFIPILWGIPTGHNITGCVAYIRAEWSAKWEGRSREWFFNHALTPIGHPACRGYALYKFNILHNHITPTFCRINTLMFYRNNQAPHLINLPQKYYKIKICFLLKSYFLCADSKKYTFWNLRFIWQINKKLFDFRLKFCAICIKMIFKYLKKMKSQNVYFLRLHHKKFNIKLF